jgi:hypothetical protein
VLTYVVTINHTTRLFLGRDPPCAMGVSSPRDRTSARTPLASSVCSDRKTASRPRP